MAIELVKRGKKVILVGRTASTLPSVAKEIGATAFYVLDTGDIPSIVPFIQKVIAEHPDLDCLINNAGVQRLHEILGPDYPFDLDSADQEMNINIRGPLHLSVGLVQRHFSKLEGGAVVMNVSSTLGFLPGAVICPVYNGTKAFLHAFTVNLRTQLARADSKIKVVEIVPPLVETDLHRDRLDRGDSRRAVRALSVEDFMKETVEGWEGDKDVVAVGMGKVIVEAWDRAIGDRYAEWIK